MAALSPAAQDRLFVFGLGLTACAVIGVMRHMLIQYRDAAAVSPSPNKPQYITQEVEDSLKLSTLGKLLESPNYSIQETTAVIICERAIHDETTIDALLWHITRPEYDMREKGIRALTMMMNNTTVDLVNKPNTYKCLIRCLELCITDYSHNPYDPEWDNWHFRDVIEQCCLLILGHLVDRHGVDWLVKLRFVDRWLAKEPWGDDEEQRLFNFMDSLMKGNRLNQIMLPLFRDEVGKKQLTEAKLVPPTSDFVRFWKNDLQRDGAFRYGHDGAFIDELTSTVDVRMINGEGTAGEDFDGMFVENRRRRDQSSEEEHLRRRHREAMVLNDGTRPLGRGDIIERER